MLPVRSDASVGAIKPTAAVTDICAHSSRINVLMIGKEDVYVVYNAHGSIGTLSNGGVRVVESVCVNVFITLWLIHTKGNKPVSLDFATIYVSCYGSRGT